MILTSIKPITTEYAKPQTRTVTNVTIEFGNPKCDCKNYGICKVDLGFNSYFNNYSYKKSLALIYSSIHSTFLLIIKNSIHEKSKSYYFKNSDFIVQSRYTLPDFVGNTKSNIIYTIEKGIYNGTIGNIHIIPIQKKLLPQNINYYAQ